MITWFYTRVHDAIKVHVKHANPDPEEQLPEVTEQDQTEQPSSEEHQLAVEVGTEAENKTKVVEESKNTGYDISQNTNPW